MVGLTRSTVCQLYIEQCRKKKHRVTVTHHLSDYCMRALYCHVMLSVNTALSNYTTYWPARKKISSLLKLMSSILIFRKQYACQGCQSVITAKHTVQGTFEDNKFHIFAKASTDEKLPELVQGTLAQSNSADTKRNFSGSLIRSCTQYHTPSPQHRLFNLIAIIIFNVHTQ